MEIIIFALIVALVTVVPVKIAATILKAENTGFFICFIAIIGATFANDLASYLFENSFLEFVAEVLFTAGVFSLLLDAKYIQSIFIALLTYVLMIGIGLMIAGSGLGSVSIA